MNTSSPSRSMILTADEVRDALAGNLVEIIRKVKPQPGIHVSMPPARLYKGNRWGCSKDAESIRCPFNVDDTIWVRETCSLSGEAVSYRADGEMLDHFRRKGCRWRSSMHMPQWASRLTLRVTSVRVEQREGKWCWIVGVEVVKAA